MNTNICQHINSIYFTSTKTMSITNGISIFVIKQPCFITLKNPTTYIKNPINICHYFPEPGYTCFTFQCCDFLSISVHYCSLGKRWFFFFGGCKRRWTIIALRESYLSCVLSSFSRCAWTHLPFFRCVNGLFVG